VAHWEHCSLLELVQVTVPVQFGMAVQVGQVSAIPFTRYRPAAQVVHCWFVPEEQVTAEVQPSMAVHAAQESWTPSTR
jgi:hypothetical protein